jgi:hypothetical protein
MIHLLALILGLSVFDIIVHRGEFLKHCWRELTGNNDAT